MPNTRTSSETSITWFFFNAKNRQSKAYTLDVPGHRSGLTLDKLDWVAALKRRFRFSADETTLDFWTVNF